MIQAIKGVFENNLDNMDWMDEKTKLYAKDKARISNYIHVCDRKRNQNFIAGMLMSIDRSGF